MFMMKIAPNILTRFVQAGPSEVGRLGQLEPPHIFTNNLRLHVIEKD